MAVGHLMSFSQRNLRKRSIEDSGLSLGTSPCKMSLSQQPESDWQGKWGLLGRRKHGGLWWTYVLLGCSFSTAGYPVGCWEWRSREKPLRFTRKWPQPESRSCFPPLLNSSHPKADWGQRPLSVSARHALSQDRRVGNSLCRAQHA